MYLGDYHKINTKRKARYYGSNELSLTNYKLKL